jgi:hypothetical protein
LQRAFVFLAVILDTFSRKVVGWQLDHTLAVRLPLTGLERAIADRWSRTSMEQNRRAVAQRYEVPLFRKNDDERHRYPYFCVGLPISSNVRRFGG